MKKVGYSIIGAAVAATSVALIAGYSVKKKKTDSACAGMLLAGLAGLVVGAAIAYEPTRQATKRLASTDEMLEEEDVNLVKENISEVLGNSADRGEKAQELRQIELDEEATIEDFMN